MPGADWMLARLLGSMLAQGVWALVLLAAVCTGRSNAIRTVKLLPRASPLGNFTVNESLSARRAVNL